MSDRVDVCIVGAGPAGATAAKRFRDAGFDVVVIEQGHWPDRTVARGGNVDFEIRQDRDWQWNPNTRSAPSDYPIDDSSSDISPLMWNGIGGSAVLYAAQWMRSLPSDFRVRTLDGVGDDWPLTYAELEPFYERVEADFGASGLDGDPAYPSWRGLPMPPVPLGAGGRRLAEAMNRLGWHWWPGSNGIATRPYRQLQPSAQRSDAMWGYADGSKASVDITHWPGLIAAGAVVRIGCRASRIVVDGHDRATGVEYFDETGASCFQPAAVVVICANGIGTPRLLLLSQTAGHPDGLGNSTGLVGRRLMMHPVSCVIGVFDEDLGTERGTWGQTLYSLQFYETDVSRGFVRGAKWGLQPAGGPQRVSGAYPWETFPIWGDGFQQQLRARLGRSLLWVTCAEDLPNEANRVTLSADRNDSSGLPGVRIEYQTSENSKRMLAWHNERMAESFREAGASEVLIAPQVRESGWHLLGTAMMGDDPRSSVVDRWGKIHDAANVYVFDGSIWPTSSGVNPTATIAAVALRCADHLVRTRREVTPS